MGNRREPDDRFAVTGRQLRTRTLLEEAAQRPGIPEVVRVYEEWTRIDMVVDNHRTIVGWRGTFANRTDAGETA